MLTFQEGLQQKLDTDPAFRKSATGKRVKRLLALPDSNPRKKRVLDRLEKHARVHLGKSEKQKIDWGAIDWTKLLELFAMILKMILALFGL